jgi:hypothetical protein
VESEIAAVSVAATALVIGVLATLQETGVHLAASAVTARAAAATAAVPASVAVASAAVVAVAAALAVGAAEVVVGLAAAVAVAVAVAAVVEEEAAEDVDDRQVSKGADYEIKNFQTKTSGVSRFRARYCLFVRAG